MRKTMSRYTTSMCLLKQYHPIEWRNQCDISHQGLLENPWQVRAQVGVEYIHDKVLQ